MLPKFPLHDHATFMRYAVERACESPPGPDKFCVGAVLVNGDTGQILSTGYSLELPGYMEGDTGSAHAEQCCFIKIARQHGLPASLAEKHILDVLPSNTVLYTTMEPCNSRLSGARTCCDRIVALKGTLTKVYVGTREPDTFISKNDGKQRLEREGFEFIQIEETKDLCYKAAMAGHGSCAPP